MGILRLKNAGHCIFRRGNNTKSTLYFFLVKLGNQPLVVRPPVEKKLSHSLRYCNSVIKSGIIHQWKFMWSFSIAEYIAIFSSTFGDGFLFRRRHKACLLMSLKICPRHDQQILTCRYIKIGLFVLSYLVFWFLQRFFLICVFYFPFFFWTFDGWRRPTFRSSLSCIRTCTRHISSSISSRVEATRKRTRWPFPSSARRCPWTPYPSWVCQHWCGSWDR